MHRRSGLSATIGVTVNPNFHHFCKNNAPFSTRNKRTANDVSCLRMPVVFYVLNDNSAVARPTHKLVTPV